MNLDGIAIVGMTGRFPQAPDLTQFWRNLQEGVEAVSFFSDVELEEVGVAPSLLHNPNYIKAKAVLEDADLFDAHFFDFSPREAELTDPQIRVFLECAWEALENAAYNPDRFPGLIGVYAGMSFSSYMMNLFATTMGARSFNSFRALLGSDKDYLSTWVSYKLNLHGPSFNIQTACSTALAAVHLACRALIMFECDMALAGGVSIAVPQRSGYMYEPGSIFSSDGHCRTFDARSDGSMAGEGVGVVLLKRLEDALAAGDTIHAIIRGSAVNNDGRRKVGYTAPAVDGQAEAISMALANAQVERHNVAYIEAHGSGTKVGDPIEIAALNKVYAESGAERGSIAIGSVKTNIGHLGPAAGIASLLKTVLAIQHGQIPPSLHFEFPNPQIPFERGPFRVNNVLSPWPVRNRPRRAGVSSFGVGGTNVHAILEQAPDAAPTDPAKPWQLLVLSARTALALDRVTERLMQHLRANPDQNCADVAFTLQAGRKAFEHRRAVVCRDARHAVELLESRAGLATGVASNRRATAFLLPGLGDHYIDMGRGLYEREPEFKNHVDSCCDFLLPHLNFDLRTVMYPLQTVRPQDGTGSDKRLDFRKIVQSGHENGSGENGLRRTVWAQPALFVLEYALAKLWMSWGIVPESMLGYSIGEYVAATLAGVISIEDSLRLLADRACRIEALEPGAMLAIAADEDKVRAMIPAEVSVAGTNGPALCVVAGPVDAIAALEHSIVDKGDIVCRRLKTAHAFHSPMMEPVAAALTEKARSIRLSPPQIPYISNVTGTWTTSAEATDPAYWARHLCQPVRFAEGLRELCSKSLPILLEVGPGQMLSSIAEQYLAGTEVRSRLILPSLPHASDPKPDRAFVLQSLAQIWLTGTEPDWAAVHRGERRGRLSLPTYPFERKRYWIETRMPRVEEQIAAQVEGIRSVDGIESYPPVRVPERAGGNGMHSRPDLGVDYAAPTNEVEQKVVSIWENLMGTGPIGINDNFLRLGGNSLLAIRVAAELRAAFQIEFPIQALMTASTPAELALVIHDALITVIEGMDETEIS